jgi:hypothetical protein
MAQGLLMDEVGEGSHVLGRLYGVTYVLDGEEITHAIASSTELRVGATVEAAGRRWRVAEITPYPASRCWKPISS